MDAQRDSRRNFLGKVASGLAGTLAAAPARVLGANDRIRLGVIGAGDRGMELVNQVRACPNTEISAFADVYTKRLERAQAVVPGAAAHMDFRRLLEDSALDAVIIATPQHLHAEHFCASLDAGKHIYLEKTLALTFDQAKRMRTAYRSDRGRHTVQIGHQACSFGHMADVRQFLSHPGRMGKITAISMQMHRNTPRNKPLWARPALFTPDLRASNVAWEAFLGETSLPDGGKDRGDDKSPRAFDPQRLVHWRYFWDYSGGSVFENMSQQLSFWYKALRLEIPSTASMDGGIYLWKDGREVPDTVSVALQQPEEILVSWVSGMGNNQLGVGEDVLGTHGAISRSSQVRYAPQKINQPEGVEMTGRTAHVPHAHMQDFIDSIRTAKEPNCPFELGYRVSIACRMAIESYLQGRTVRWDREREQMA